MAFLRVVQIKSLLLGSDGMYGTVLHTAARGGNIGVWAALVDGLKKERLLEEVGVDESGTFRRFYDGVSHLIAALFSRTESVQA